MTLKIGTVDVHRGAAKDSSGSTTAGHMHSVTVRYQPRAVKFKQ
jgi:hypothetical protein